MFVVNSYSLAVIFCFITMLCWGSWGNTQKLAGKTWRYELFYWDYVIGMVLFAILLGFTMGSIGTEGRPFLEDLAQAEWGGIGSVVLGGVIFNASNILLSASVSLAGLSVAFPLGVGLALVLGVIVNYVGAPKGDPVVLFLGVALIVVAIICNGIASGRMRKSGDSAAQNRKGIILAVVAGVLMSFFYRFVAAAMDLDNFAAPTPGMLTPYSAIFVFSVGGSGFFGPGSPYINLFDTCDQWDGWDFDNRICATCRNKQMLYPLFTCRFKPKNASS